MYSRKSYLIPLLSCLLFLTACAKVIEVTVRDIDGKSFAISTHDKFWRKGVCIASVIVQRGGKTVWVAGVDSASRVCLDSIRYPRASPDFTVSKSLDIAKTGIYSVSVFSDAGDGSSNFEIK